MLIFCRPYWALYALMAVSLLGSETRTWEQNDRNDFTRGTTDHLSIRSDGRVQLAPVFRQLDESNVPYLWSMARNSKGMLYYAGGAPTGSTVKVFWLAANEKTPKSKVFAEMNGLEIHALAVDAQDRVYAAVLPDAKVYRIGADGKPQLFFDPKAKYIWAMAVNKAGDLFVATGDQGIVYRVTPDGKGTEFFRTDETHARSMIIDHQGNLIIGTEPGGLVIRVTPAGKGFVLFQTNRREVTAVAEENGTIYAASVGGKAVSVAPSGPTAQSSPTAPPAASPRTMTPSADRAGAAPRALTPAPNTLSGGSEIYRIAADGFAQGIWQSATDIIYAIGFDATGKPLLGSGNRGVVFRLDSDQVYTELLKAPPTQITCLLPGPKGIVYAATGNVGRIYQIGPGMEDSGTLESDVLDVGSFARWGKVHVQAVAAGDGYTMETRSGNVNRPQKSWSEWTSAPISRLGGQVPSPNARFLQYRLTLKRAGNGESPQITEVQLSYEPRNIAPRLLRVELAPLNYRAPTTSAGLERNVTASGSPITLTLPGVGMRSPPSAGSAAANPGVTLTYAKGHVTARWLATDENDDTLIYRLEIKGKGETAWRLLKDKLSEPFYSWDGNAMPDGEYVLRVTASDAPSNAPKEECSTSLESDPFTVDNTPPVISDEKIAKEGRSTVVSFVAQDDLNWISKAEYSVDGTSWTNILPANRVTDSQRLEYRVTLPENIATASIAVRVFDEDDNVAVKKFSGVAK